jgi:hypothetical protein
VSVGGRWCAVSLTKFLGQVAVRGDANERLGIFVSFEWLLHRADCSELLCLLRFVSLF